MSDNTHGPPVDDDAARKPLTYGVPRDNAHLAQQRAMMLGSPGYRLLTAALRSRGEPIDPLDLVATMANGGYRWLRDADQAVVCDEGGDRRDDFMSFRVISAELHRLTREHVSHETLRRWWARIWPDVPVPEHAFRQANAQAADRLRGRNAEAQPEPSAATVPPAVFIPPSAA